MRIEQAYFWAGFLTVFATHAAASSSSFGKGPLRFEENRGQIDSRVKFLSRGDGYSLFLTGGGATLRLAKAAIRMSFAGAKPDVLPVGETELPGKINYLVGRDPAQWHTNLATYGTVRYRALYPGIDLLFYGKDRALEYDFLLEPGADPNRIAVAFEGVERLELARSGDLVIHAALGEEVRFHRPAIYQMDGAKKQPIEGAFALHGRRAGFQVGQYDRTRPLIIDPVLVYASYIGAGNTASSFPPAVAVDSAGAAYFSGTADSTAYPTTAGALQTSLKGQADLYIAKFSPAGNSLVYATYLGGTAGEWNYNAHVLSVDAGGNVYLAGNTNSLDFPTTASAFQPNCVIWNGSCQAAFFSKINATGTALLYSTYLGGYGENTLYALTIDASGRAYLAGETSAYDFPTTANSYYSRLPDYCVGIPDAGGFITELNPAASGAASLVYSTYFDSPGYYVVNPNSNSPYIGCAPIIDAIAVDSAGHPFVTGFRWSPDQNFFDIKTYAFAAELDTTRPGTSALVGLYYFGNDGYSPGATNQVVPYAIAADNSGFAYVTGAIAGCFGISADICTVNGFQPVLQGSSDAFVGKVNPVTGVAAYTSYLGGTCTYGELGFGIAVDGSGNAYVDGVTCSADFPVVHPLQSWPPGAGSTAFLTKVNPTGQQLLYSTLFGSNSDATSVALDSAANAYLSGYVTPPGAVPTLGAVQPAPAGTYYTPFLAKISPADAPGIGFEPEKIDFGQAPIGSTDGRTMTLVAAGDQNLVINSISISGSDYTQTNTCAGLVAAGSCTFSITFKPTGPGTRTGSLMIADNAAGSPHTIALTGVGTGPAISLSPPSLNFGNQLQGTTGTQTITLTSTGASAVTISSILTSSPFSASSTTCPINQPIAPGAQCTITVSFTPQTTGPANSSLTIAATVFLGYVPVSLSGNGTNFALALSPTAGGGWQGVQTSSTAMVGPISGFSGTVTLACSAPNSNLTCSVSPTTVTMGKTARATVKFGSSTKTPPGKYTFTVAAIFGKIVHTATYTLTISGI